MLIKRRLNVILTKFKRYSNVISTSPSPKTCHWDSPGGGTASVVLSFYRHYLLFIIIYHPFTLQIVRLRSLDLRRYLWKFCALHKSFSFFLKIDSVGHRY